VQDILHPSRQALGPIQPPIQWVPGHSWGKWPGRGVDHPPPYSAEVKVRVELYLYPTSSGPSWPVLGRTYFFTCHLDGKYWNYSQIVHSIYNKKKKKKVNILVMLLKNNRNLMNGIKVNKFKYFFSAY
jgi:hypothetical protein